MERLGRERTRSWALRLGSVVRELDHPSSGEIDECHHAVVASDCEPAALPRGGKRAYRIGEGLHGIGVDRTTLHRLPPPPITAENRSEQFTVVLDRRRLST